ncbi:MAG: hypothetical protein ABIA93_04015 [Candidatus Woesearchaeota archaeon]
MTATEVPPDSHLDLDVALLDSDTFPLDNPDKIRFELRRMLTSHFGTIRLVRPVARDRELFFEFVLPEAVLASRGGQYKIYSVPDLYYRACQIFRRDNLVGDSLEGYFLKQM